MATLVLVETGQAIEESRLAGAIGPDQAVDLAAANGQRNIMQGLDAAEMLGHRVRFEKNLVFTHQSVTLGKFAATQRRRPQAGRTEAHDEHQREAENQHPQALRINDHAPEDSSL
jgi:hypothetical protein